MPAPEMGSLTGGSNEFGITNVSSTGNVSITVVPPRQASRSQSIHSSQETLSSVHNARVDTQAVDNQTPRSQRKISSANYLPPGVKDHEKNELDEILRELLGESHLSEKISVPRSARTEQYAPPKSPRSAPSTSGQRSSDNTWLAQQQQKLIERQRSRDNDDITQLHRQQKQLVSELKHIQTRRQVSRDDGGIDTGDLYKTERDIQLSSSPHEQSAYTVYIKPDEYKKKRDDSPKRVHTKSVTNVSHTHHTHYNFQDKGDEADGGMRQTLEEQKQRIAQLEDELRHVKMGMEQPPLRPTKLEIEEDEDEDEILFKPIGIASLESGTAGVNYRPSHWSTNPPINSVNPSANRPHHATHPTATDKPPSAANGHTTVQAHTLQSQSSYGGTATTPASFTGPLSPTFFQVGTSPRTPTTPYQLVSPTQPASTDYSQTNSQSHHQRIIEEQRIQQQIYQQSMMNQPQQPAAVTQTRRTDSHVEQSSTSLPLTQALHVNTRTASVPDPATNGAFSVTSAQSAASNQGHFQFISETGDNQGADQLTAKFVKDTSKYWYKPHISREEVISRLKSAAPGTFIVRDSNSFPGAFGLAVKVAHLPPGIQVKPSADPATEYVRFYLIEPTTKGVKLKGCSNEPVFASLASLIYQHTITPLALPCKLLLPDPDQYHFEAGSPGSVAGVDDVDGYTPEGAARSEGMGNASDLLKRGAACNVVYLNCVDTESLTGPQAISRALHKTFTNSNLDTTIASFKVASDGITVTDTQRKLFFRYHFPKDSVSYCGMDPADRRFTQSIEGKNHVSEAKIFGFVAKKKGGNQCLLFAEYDQEQPATAVVNFVAKVLLNNR